MKLEKILSICVLAGMSSCHSPVLLTEMSPDAQPKDKFKYYNPEFQLQKNSMLKTDGLYYKIGEPRKVPITYKAFIEAKKHGIAPAGFTLDELDIHSDTVLTVVNTDVILFYPNGTFVLTVYHNKSKEEIKKDAINRFKDVQDGWYVYKLENHQIQYEYYSKMSGFNYAEGEIRENQVTFGKSKPFQFLPFTN